MIRNNINEPINDNILQKTWCDRETITSFIKKAPVHEEILEIIQDKLLNISMKQREKKELNHNTQNVAFFVSFIYNVKSISYYSLLLRYHIDKSYTGWSKKKFMM